jgi:hypothetical protein
MNCPSRTDNPNGREGWNQSPNLHSGSTREDFNGMANTRVLRRIGPGEPVLINSDDEVSDAQKSRKISAAAVRIATVSTSQKVDGDYGNPGVLHCDDSSGNRKHFCLPSFLSKIRKVLLTFGKFVGPGFMVRTPLCVKQMRLGTQCLWLTSCRYPLHILILGIIQRMWRQVLAINFSSFSLSCSQILLPYIFSRSVSSWAQSREWTLLRCVGLIFQDGSIFLSISWQSAL